MEKEDLPKVVLLLACIFLVITVILYEIFPASIVASFASFLSATGTLGILILTAFYVVFTNRQITELKKQRELNLQPLPNIRITEAAISRPRLTASPSDGSVGTAINIYFKCAIENVGNAAAVMVDTIFQFTGTALDRHYDEFWARRFHVIKESEKFYFIEDLMEKSPELLNAINKSLFAEGCPRKGFFSIMVHIKILYRNILGTPFLLTLDNVVRVDQKYKKTLASWIGIMETFESEFATKLSTYKAVFQRSPEDADELYEELKAILRGKFTEDVMPIEVLPWSASFNVKPLESNELAELEKKIHHSLPVNIGSDRIVMLDETKTIVEHLNPWH